MRIRIRHNLRLILANYNLLRFRIRNLFLGFEYANNIVKSIDKNSLILILKKYGSKIGKNCDIESGITFHNCINYSNLIIGNDCHIGKNCFFDLREKVEINHNVTISMDCKLITHQDMGKSSLDLLYGKTRSPIKIDNNVYIGAGVTILQGTNIGSQSIVAAGSVVTHDVKPKTIVGGIPAKHLKSIKS